MLSPSVVDEVKKMLAAGDLSQRKIARLLCVSRATVGLIAGGRRPDYELRPRPADSFWQPLGPIGRCSSCGGMVYLPCMLCRVRSVKRHDRRTSHQPSARCA
jgi:hypothetical protein